MQTTAQKISALRSIIEQATRDIEGMMRGPITPSNKRELINTIQYRASIECDLVRLLAEA